MRRLLAAAAVALAFASSAMAAPEDTYRLVRLLPNGNEQLQGEWTVADMSQSGLTQEQLIRQTALDASRQQRTNNPAWRLLLYGPTNGGPYTRDDVIWDSLVSQ